MNVCSRVPSLAFKVSGLIFDCISFAPARSTVKHSSQVVIPTLRHVGRPSRSIDTPSPPVLLVPTLGTLPSMSLIPVARLKLLRSRLTRCCPRSFTFYVAFPVAPFNF
jgi:hypothetical protein